MTAKQVWKLMLTITLTFGVVLGAGGGILLLAGRESSDDAGALGYALRAPFGWTLLIVSAAFLVTSFSLYDQFKAAQAEAAKAARESAGGTITA